ncbi:MAG: SPFH domain-containing protein [Waterburya sp.]
MKWLQFLLRLSVTLAIVTSSSTRINGSTLVLATESNSSIKTFEKDSTKKIFSETLKSDSNVKQQEILTSSIVNSNFPLVIAVIPTGIQTGILMVTVGGIILLFRPRIVHIGRNEIGIVYKKFGRHLPSNRQIALNGEMGNQIDTLDPGRHFLFPSWMYEVIKDKAIQIDTDEIGIVKAKDGASLPSGKMFGKVIECSDFQDGRAFINQGGQRGQQLGILRNGIYRINPKLFAVEKSALVHIHDYEIGLVEAKDGQPLPAGKTFGNAVECSNFEDAQAFISNGGSRGKQLKILTAGKYAINTELFKINRVDTTIIKADEIGLVEAKDGQPLPLGQNFGRVVECNNFQDAEAFIRNGGQNGKQLAIIPPGSYDINTELFKVNNVPVIYIPSGEIGLIIAQDGASLSPGQILSKTVESNNFQNAEAFIKNGGQKGKQIAILTSGTYRINTELFTVITAKNAQKHGMKSEELKVYTVESDKIGIATTVDGKPLLNGNIAGSIIDGHNKFQNVQKFIDLGGYRGLQEEVLEEGSWNLNPWFVKIEQVPLTEIEAGTVGVVISNIGDDAKQDAEQNERENTNKSNFNIVSRGYKGIEEIPLETGKYPLNTRAKSIEIVPSCEIILNWTNQDKPATSYDSNLKTLKLRSKDGFSFQLEVTQVINIAPQDAPKMISRVGSPIEVADQFSVDGIKYSSIQNLVTGVLEPMVGNYFRNSAQKYDALDFLEKRDEIQEGATEHIKNALNAYGVQAVGTFINEIDLPDELEKPKQEQKISEVERATLMEHQKTERVRHDIAKEKVHAEAERVLLKAEREREIVEKELKVQQLKNDENLRQKEKEIQLELDRQRQESGIKTDEQERIAQIEVYTQESEKQIELTVFKETLNTLSPELYVKIETDKRWAEAFSKFNFTAPTTLITGGGDSNTGGLEALYSGEIQMKMIEMLTDRLSKRKSNNLQPNNLQSEVLKSDDSQTDILNPENLLNAFSDEDN